MSFKVKGLVELQRAYKAASLAMKIGEARAVKRVGVTIKATQAREIGQTLNLRIGTIKDELRVAKQPTPEAPRVVFEVKQRGVPLKEFLGTVQTKKGVRVRTTKKKPARVMKAAFGLEQFGGHFFGRAAKGSNRYGSPHVGRTPIVKLFGPNVLSQFISEALQAKGREVWETRLPIELERETSFALKKAGLL